MTDKLIVIVGATASGKSSLAVNLAQKFDGVIVSADSRQVYQGMNIGTGKITKREQKTVPHHLLNVASPKKQFTVARYQKLATDALKIIHKKNKLPFLVGGSPFYIYALIDNLAIPAVKPNLKLRKGLGRKTARELYAILKNLDPKRAKAIDRHNPRRLIRAIEINLVSGRVVPNLSGKKIQANVLLLGIYKKPQELRSLINKRVDKRLKQGMVVEVKKLQRQGLSFKKLEQFGLEYRYISRYLQGKINYREMVNQLKNAVWRFSRRQITWFKRDKRIRWISNKKQAEKQIQNFLK